MNEKDIYLEEAHERINSMKNALIVLNEKPCDKNALHDIINCSHGLKGNSMQEGFFIVAYFSHIINVIVRDIEEGRVEATEENIAFIYDFLGSLEKTLDRYIERKKKYDINKQLFEKLDKIMRKEFRKPMKKEIRGIYEDEVRRRLKIIEKLLKKLENGFNQRIIKKVVNELHTLEGIFLQAGFLKNSSICLITKDIMYKLLENKKIDKESISIIKNSVERLRMSLNLLKEV